MIDQNAFNAILTLVTAEPGFSVGLFEELRIYQLEDGRIAVDVYDSQGKCENQDLFIAPDNAVERFLNLREEMQLGFDFEKEQM